MARKISPFRLGLFVIICGALTLGVIIWLGAAHFLEATKTYVSYFNESVKGLQQDAVVNYRGVAVGRVARIGLAPDGMLIEVVMNLNADFRVHEGLVILLREQGLTGLRYLEIDTAPRDVKERTPPITFPSKYPIIPSYPSELEQLKSALESIYNQISGLDLKGLVESWTKTSEMVNSLLVKFDGAVEPKDLNETVLAMKRASQDASIFMEWLKNAASEEGMKISFDDLAAALAASRKATEALAKQLKGLPPDAFVRMTRSWNETVTSGGQTFSNFDRHLGESAALLKQSIHQLNLLLAQLTGLVQNIKDQPNQLIFKPSESDPFKRK